MNNYLSPVPYDSLQALQEIGFVRTAYFEQHMEFVSFAEAFDWLMDQGIHIEMRCHKNPEGYVFRPYINDKFSHFHLWALDWKEAAADAITEAIWVYKEMNGIPVSIMEMADAKAKKYREALEAQNSEFEYGHNVKTKEEEE